VSFIVVDNFYASDAKCKIKKTGRLLDYMLYLPNSPSSRSTCSQCYTT